MTNYATKEEIKAIANTVDQMNQYLWGLYGHINAMIATIEDIKHANPKDPSSGHNRCRPLPCQDDSSTPLSPASETRQPHVKYNRETAYPRTPDTSRCTASGSSPDTSVHVRIAFHQTSTLRESYAQLLSQTLSSVLAQHGKSSLTDELFQVLSCLLSTPELGCHVERREGHIRIRFLSETHPVSEHSELSLHLNSHSS